MHSNKLSTSKIMIFAVALAFLANIPFYSWIFSKDVGFATGFPIGWIGAGMVYMATFFHEIGHTVFAWFYGYPTIPTFDFKHGGGMAWSFSGQQVPILIMVWALLGYGFWYLRAHRLAQFGIVLFVILNLSLAFNDYHYVVLDFMGPAFECIVASFFLYRALLDLAPRGDLERFLNAFFGFGMIFQVFVNAYGLLKSEAYRLVYYEQKGSHGFGDFDKVADMIPFLTFDGVVGAWIIVNIICLIIPFMLFIRHMSYEEV